jgi:hypothetical protein
MLSGAGMAAVDGVFAAGGVAGMAVDGAGVVAGGVSFAGGVVCDQTGALSAMTIAADARSRDFIVASFAGDLFGAGPRQNKRAARFGPIEDVGVRPPLP